MLMRWQNFAVGKEGASTKVATNVIALQAALPSARIVYCSATGVSEGALLWSPAWICAA